MIFHMTKTQTVLLSLTGQVKPDSVSHGQETSSQKCIIIFAKQVESCGKNIYLLFLKYTIALQANAKYKFSSI